MLLKVPHDDFYGTWCAIPEFRAEFLLRIFGKASSLEQVVNHSAACLLFAQFLESEHAAENLNFMAAVRSYKNAYTTQPVESVSENAMSIFETFLKANAQFQVNVPQIMIQHCMSVLDKAECKVDPAQRIPPISVFDECFAEISKLTERGPFPRFRKSQRFHEFLLQIRAYDADFDDLEAAKVKLCTRRASFAPPPNPDQLMQIIFTGVQKARNV